MGDCKLLQKGTIRIGIPPMIGAFVFPRILAEFAKRYPGVEIVAREVGTLSIKEKLEQDELDLGMILQSQLSARLETTPLANGKIMVCLPAGHRLAALARGIALSRTSNSPPTKSAPSCASSSKASAFPSCLMPWCPSMPTFVRARWPSRCISISSWRGTARATCPNRPKPSLTLSSNCISECGVRNAILAGADLIRS